MKVLKFLFPIAFRSFPKGGGLLRSIFLHVAVLLLYYVIAPSVFLVSLPLWFVLFLIPVLSAVFVILFLVFFFALLIVGIIIPFYCAGGIVLAILNNKRVLSVLD